MDGYRLFRNHRLRGNKEGFSTSRRKGLNAQSTAIEKVTGKSKLMQQDHRGSQCKEDVISVYYRLPQEE